MTAPRKSWAQRLPSSGGVWSAVYVAGLAEWQRIETAYGHALEISARATILVAVKEYLRDAPFETHAPFLREAMAWLRELEKAARCLNRAMVSETHSPKADAAFYAQRAIEHHIRDPRSKEQLKWGTLIGSAMALTAAISLAKREIPKEACVGFVEGEAWNAFIRRLTEIVKQFELPYRASKGTDKTPKAEPSPFVRMVRALQLTFPPELRRHNGSYQAAAEAIAKARRGGTKRKINAAEPQR